MCYIVPNFLSHFFALQQWILLPSLMHCGWCKHTTLLPHLQITFPRQPFRPLLLFTAKRVTKHWWYAHIVTLDLLWQTQCTSGPDWSIHDCHISEKCGCQVEVTGLGFWKSRRWREAEMPFGQICRYCQAWNSVLPRLESSHPCFWSQSISSSQARWNWS